LHTVEKKKWAPSRVTEANGVPKVNVKQLSDHLDQYPAGVREFLHPGDDPMSQNVESQKRTKVCLDSATDDDSLRSI